MNRTDLIEQIAEKTEVSKAAAGRMLEVALGAIEGALKKGDSVTLTGFGSFSVTKRAARAGVNPRTGAKLKIAATKVARFKAGSGLRVAVSGKRGK